MTKSEIVSRCEYTVLTYLWAAPRLRSVDGDKSSKELSKAAVERKVLMKGMLRREEDMKFLYSLATW